MQGLQVERYQLIAGVGEGGGLQGDFPEFAYIPLGLAVAWAKDLLALAIVNSQEPSRAVHSSRSWLASRRCRRRRMISAR
jgi:hypothetical protein